MRKLTIIILLTLVATNIQLSGARVLNFKNETDYELCLYLTGIYKDTNKKGIYRKHINTDYIIGPQKEGAYNVQDKNTDFFYFVVKDKGNPPILLDIENNHLYKIEYHQEFVIDITDNSMCVIS